MNHSKQVSLISLLVTALVWMPAREIHAAPKDDTWALCHTDLPAADVKSSNLSPPDATAPTIITSDYGESTGTEQYILQGEVHLRRGTQTIQADSVKFDNLSGRAEASGQIRFQEGGMHVEGKAADLNLRTNTGYFLDAEYQLSDQHARGSAAEVYRESADFTRLEQATYTTCNPGDNAWDLRAGTVKLYHDEGVGSATNVTLRTHHFPFFYLPYINFPLNDERKTGLLPPRFGYSDTSGVEVGIPVYLNLAPNRDATIIPRYIEQRGMLTQGEFRYLGSKSTGIIRAEYISDNDYRNDRGQFSYQHRSVINPRWQAGLDYNYVSDAFYFGHIGNSLSLASTTHLDRRLDVSYNGTYGSVVSRLQGYQTVDPTIPGFDRPYQRLPQILVSAEAPQHPLGTDLSLQGEFVRFEREDSVRGSRLIIQPALSFAYETIGMFIKPQISMQHAQYMLDNQMQNTASTLTRTAPIYSLDSGVFLERDLTLLNQPMIQTLEPRLFYLYIPYRDQSALPVFDTSSYDFGLSQMFRDNRYAGSDRLGDTNQLSTTVTTRLLNGYDGIERLKLSLGRIFYYQNRKVTLPGETIDTQSASDMVAEAALKLNSDWSAVSELQWDPDEDMINKGSINLHYQSGPHHIFNIGHRFRRDHLDQAEVSLLWPIGLHWRLGGRWNYSYLDDRILETFIGAQYESCCWTFRATKRHYVSDIVGNVNSTVYLEIELKGLTRLGNSIEDLFERGILGYQGNR